MKICKIVTKSLLVIGALNWGLVGFFKYNLVSHIFGGSEAAMGARVIFALVGLAGVSALTCCIRSCCGSCSSSSCGCDCGCKSCCNKSMKK